MIELLASVDWIVAARQWPDDMKWWPDGPTLPMEPLIWGVRIAGVILLAVAGVSIGQRVWRRLAPIAAYNRVARQLGVDPVDRWRLWRVAKFARLESPVTLLVCSATMEHFADRLRQRGGDGGALTHHRAAHAARHLMRVRSQLFD